MSVVVVSAADEASPAGFWAHYNIVIVTYLYIYIMGLAITGHNLSARNEVLYSKALYKSTLLYFTLLCYSVFK